MIIFKKTKLLFILLIILIGLLITWSVNTGVLKRLLTGKSPFGKEKKVEEIAKEALPEQIVPVRVYRVVLKDFTDTLPVMGYIKGLSTVDLKFELSGRITAINFKEGDLVKKGDIIATLDQKDALLKLEYNESKFKAAQKQIEAANKRFEVYEELYKLGSITRLKYEEARADNESAIAQLDTAEKELEFAKSELEKTSLASYVDGVMGPLIMDVGDYVSTAYSTKMGELYNIESVYADLGVVEKDIEKVKIGQKVKVNVDACPGVDFEGTIDNIVPIIEGKSRTMTVKVTLQNPEGRLLPGMFVRAVIYIFEEKNTIVIPNTALYDLDGDGKFDSVFVVDAEKVAHAKQVNIGYLTADYAQILEGLDEEDLAVVEVQGQIKDGTRVEVLETQEAPPSEGERPPTAPIESEGP